MTPQEQVEQFKKLQSSTDSGGLVVNEQAAAILDALRDSPIAATLTDALARLEKIRKLAQSIVDCDTSSRCEECDEAAQKILDLTDLSKPLT